MIGIFAAFFFSFLFFSVAVDGKLERLFLSEIRLDDGVDFVCFVVAVVVFLAFGNSFFALLLFTVSFGTSRELLLLIVTSICCGTVTTPS